MLNAECYVLEIYGDLLGPFYYAEGFEGKTCLQSSYTSTEPWIYFIKHEECKEEFTYALLWERFYDVNQIITSQNFFLSFHSSE